MHEKKYTNPDQLRSELHKLKESDEYKTVFKLIETTTKFDDTILKNDQFEKELIEKMTTMRDEIEQISNHVRTIIPYTTHFDALYTSYIQKLNSTYNQKQAYLSQQ